MEQHCPRPIYLTRSPLCSDDDAAVADREPGFDGVGAAAHPVYLPSGPFEDGEALFAAVCARGLEGVAATLT